MPAARSRFSGAASPPHRGASLGGHGRLSPTGEAPRSSCFWNGWQQFRARLMSGLRAVHSCKQNPALGFLRCWHQFFPLEWWDFTERLRAIREGSREAQVVIFGSRVVKTFIMKGRSFVIQLYCYNVQYRIWRVLGGKVSSHVVIMQPSAVLGRFKNALCVSWVGLCKRLTEIL